MRRIAWVGDPSPYRDREVAYAVWTGRVHPADLALIRQIEAVRRKAVVGVSRLVVGPAHGFSQTYVWGPWPGTFEVDMADEDAALLLGNPLDAPMFADRTEAAGPVHYGLIDRAGRDLRHTG